MNISYKWLKNYINTDLTAEEIAQLHALLDEAERKGGRKA
jgi:hypothetical protein